MAVILGNSTPSSLTPAAGTNSVVTNAGTAVIAATGPMAGGYITNPSTASVLLYVNPVTNAGTVESGTTVGLQAGQSFVFQPFKTNVTANSTSAGHTFTVVVW